MRNKKISKIICFGLVLILIVSFIVSNLFNSKTYINDYYSYINKEILDENEILDGEVGWSKFSLAQEEVDGDVEDIIFELIDNKTNSDLNVFYNNIMNVDYRKQVGISPLMKYINLIDGSRNIDEFINNAILIENELFIDIFTRSTIAPDFKDTSKTIVYFYPVTFDFGSSSDIYVNPDYSRYHALVKQYQIKLLKLYGYDKEKARAVSRQLDNFFGEVSKVSKSSEELSDVDSLYNVITKDELQSIYTNIDINRYLMLMGISNQEYFSIVDVDNYKVINSYLTNENLGLLKEYVKIKILESYGSYASLEYANLINELSDKLMGIESDSDLRNDAINLISSYFTNEIDKVYLERYFTEEDKVFIEKMVLDILNYYENNILNNEWMDSATKNKAILKLQNMSINIGGNYEESYNFNLRSFENGGSLIENVIMINKTMSDRLLVRLYSNSYENIITPTTINAYYSPLDNSINFPAALKELYNTNDDYYEVLGSMGMIIAHEVTHAFDNNGAKFDEFGNRVDWWSESDYEEFQKLQEEIINHYSEYEVVDGIYVDGKMTVGENIADLGALNCIVGIAKEKGASRDDMKKMFSSYASLWASEYIDSYLKLLVLSDSHSPDKIRVNAVLANIDSFYEVYNIDRNDAMYVDSEKRVGIW